MLWVYAGIDLISAKQRAIEDLPDKSIDFSKCPSDTLSGAVRDFCDHHRTGHIYLGYLDPLLMLHPIQETLLRRGFTHCNMSLIVSNPYLLPLSWKNGIEKLVIVNNGNRNDVISSKTLHNGSVTHVSYETGHG